MKLGSFRLSWLQLERSLDSAASSALPIDRPAQKDRTQFDISHPVIIIPFKCLKPGKGMPQRRVLRVWRLANGRLERPKNRGLCAGKGRLQPWKRVWRLANGRLERPNNRGLCAGKGRLQPWNSKGWRPEGLVEAAAKELEGFKSLKVLSVWSLAKEMPQRRVLRVWRLANGRLERPNNRGLCAGKGQAATLEQQRLTARGLGGSCREGSGMFEEV